jgi:hypothetical protein
LTFYPNINAANAVFNNITISAGASLLNSFSGANNFTINGSITNAGTFNNSGGTVTVLETGPITQHLRPAPVQLFLGALLKLLVETLLHLIA